MVPLVDIDGAMVVVGGMTERASLMASERPDGDRSSGRPESTLPERVENLGPPIDLNPTMAATVLVEEAREEAGAHEEVVRRVLQFSLCQTSSKVMPSKCY